MAPPGRGSLYVELSDRGPMPRVDDIMPDVAQALAAAGAINGADDVLFAEIKELKYAYVVFDDNYYSSVDKLIKYFEANDVFPRGRYGSWIYNAMEDSILAGREVALRLQLVKRRRTSRSSSPSTTRRASCTRRWSTS